MWRVTARLVKLLVLEAQYREKSAGFIFEAVLILLPYFKR